MITDRNADGKVDKAKWWSGNRVRYYGTANVREWGKGKENSPGLCIPVFDQERLLDNPIIDFQQDHNCCLTLFSPKAMTNFYDVGAASSAAAPCALSAPTVSSAAAAAAGTGGVCGSETRRCSNSPTLARRINESTTKNGR